MPLSFDAARLKAGNKEKPYVPLSERANSGNSGLLANLPGSFTATTAAEAAQGKKKKEQPSPYWTRLHEKNRSVVRFQKEIGRVIECDFY